MIKIVPSLQRLTVLGFAAVVVCIAGYSNVNGQAVEPPLAEPDVVSIDYNHNGDALLGYMATPTSSDGPFPAVVIIPDWDGVNFYEQVRATLMATEYGWVGFAADIYGASLQNVTDFELRVELATLYRSNATLFAQRIQAAVDVVKTLDQVDPDKIALLGFCFGGTGVLLYALEDVPDGVTTIVSMHGGLTSIVNDTIGYANLFTNANILVLSGGDDDASTDIISLEYALNNATTSTANTTSQNATTTITHGSWEITRFDGIEHAWTVWMNDAYDAWADMRTWQRADQYLKEAFGEITYQSIEPADSELTTKIMAVPYTDTTDGTELQGYVAFPDNTKWKYPAPAVIILPDWDGVNDYEKKRAILFAEEGYVGFAADIYGADLQMIENITARIELVTKYTTDISLYLSRINAALNTVTNGTIVSDPPTNDEEIVKSNSVALVGYCFGGTGVVQYAFNGGDGGKKAFQVGVAYHGGLQQLPEAKLNVSMYMLIESGGDDAAHGNQIVLEQALNDANAEWEISRYSGVVHGFTVWSDDSSTTSRSVDHSDHRTMQEMSSPYSVIADARSWMATLEIFEARMPSMALSDVPTPSNNNGTNTDDSDMSAAYGINHEMSLIFWSAVAVVVCIAIQY